MKLYIFLALCVTGQMVAYNKPDWVSVIYSKNGYVKQYKKGFSSVYKDTRKKKYYSSDDDPARLYRLLKMSLYVQLKKRQSANNL